MNILLVADSAQTGFGRVTRELASRFMAAGESVRIIGINHRGRDGEAAGLIKGGATPDQVAAHLRAYDADPLHEVIVPAIRGGDTMGHNLVDPAIRGEVWPEWTPDRMLLVADPWAVGERLMHSRLLGSVPTYNYVPIEGVGFPPNLTVLWEKITPIAMSDFGRRELERLLGRPVACIPHGVSAPFYPFTPERPGTWRGQPVRGRDEAKAALNLTDRLVILRTDRFVPRKNYPALIRAVQPVMAAHPEAILLVHCSPLDEGGSMASLVSAMPGAFETSGVWRHLQIRITGGHDTFRGWEDDALATLYNAADIYASTTMAEGFGLTLAEAAACGVPVVTTDYAAGPEVVGPGGLLAPVDRFFTNQYGFLWASVDEAAFAAALVALADDPERRASVGAAGAAHVQQWSWDTAASDFLSLMG